MKISKFVFNLILNKRQREIILQSLLYSAQTYKRSGNIDGFSEVSRVIGEMGEKFGLKERTFTAQEVEEILDKSSEIIAKEVKDLVEKSYQKGLKNGVESSTIRVGVVRRINNEELIPGMQFSKEKCESCERKDDCSLYSFLKE